MKTDTIAAIATGLSGAGISIIRISGSEALSVASRVFCFHDNRKKMETVKTQTIHYGYIFDENGRIDEVLLTVMRAPHTYTAEDVVEINCHGGILVTKRVLEAVLTHGARLALPGEFTKRAFLNGRIDLSQAEAVMDLIQSKSERARKQALGQLNGNIKTQIEEIRKNIITDTAYIEAALDDPEHISLEGFKEQLLSHNRNNLATVNQLLKTAKQGKFTKEGIRTVILGKPNVGKSSLLNAMLKEERAIVTDIEGTTRDTLEETVLIGDIFLNIIDTAGVHETTDIIEKHGLERTKKAAQSADLILFVIDGAKRLDENDSLILSLLEDKPVIVIKNKSDLESVITEKQIEEMTGKPAISISAKHSLGLQALYDEIKEMFFRNEIDAEEEVYISRERQKEALAECEKSLMRVEESVLANMPEDFYTIDLMSAYTSLGNILGEAVDDDLIDTVFREFCMGK